MVRYSVVIKAKTVKASRLYDNIDFNLGHNMHLAIHMRINWRFFRPDLKQNLFYTHILERYTNE